MSYSYFKSVDVHVYPCGYRGTDIDIYSRVNAEYNLVNNYTVAGRNNSYIIPEKSSSNYGKTVWHIVFVLGGYFFDIKNIQANNNVYVGIKAAKQAGKEDESKLLCKHGGTNSWTYGTTLDEGSYFKGLIYSNTLDDLTGEDCTDTLCLLVSKNGSIDLNTDATFNKINGVKLCGDYTDDEHASTDLKYLHLESTSNESSINVASESDLDICTPFKVGYSLNNDNFTGKPIYLYNSNSSNKESEINLRNSSTNLYYDFTVGNTVSGYESCSITLDAINQSSTCRLELSNGTMTLPSNNSTTDNNVDLDNWGSAAAVLAQYKQGISDWLDVSTQSKVNSIVYRDASGIARATTLESTSCKTNTLAADSISNLTAGNDATIVATIDQNLISLTNNTVLDLSETSKIRFGDELEIRRYDTDSDDIKAIAISNSTNSASTSVDLVFGTSGEFIYTNTTADKYFYFNKRVQAPSFYATSDKRLKENIIEYVPEKSILDLPIYKYDFIDGNKNQIGCLAQDLQEICPEIVKENQDGYLSIQESKIVYLLLDEVKKLRAEIEELKKK